MRILGLDYGSVTVGVAISDDLLLTAQGLEVIRRKEENKLRRTLARIEALIEEYHVEKIVLGYPKNMNGSIGERAKRVEEFAGHLSRRTGLPIELQDERLSTVEAHRILNMGGLDYREKAEVVDKVAAAIILQGYLDRVAGQ